jgi:hypothetical protein
LKSNSADSTRPVSEVLEAIAAKPAIKGIDEGKGNRGFFDGEYWRQMAPLERPGF